MTKCTVEQDGWKLTIDDGQNIIVLNAERGEVLQQMLKQALCGIGYMQKTVENAFATEEEHQNK
jgi:hypothetical protein